MVKVLDILAYGLVSTLPAIIGGLLVIVEKNPGRGIMAIFSGFAAGSMVGVTFAEIIPEAIELGGMSTLLGVATGIVLFFLIEEFFHLCPAFDQAHKKHKFDVGILGSLGLGLHSLSDGLAIGAGYEALPLIGLIIAFAIAVHKLPEGIGTGALLRVNKRSRFTTIAVTSLVSFLTPLGAVTSSLALGNLSALTLGFALAFAGGTLLYIAICELIPEAYHHGLERRASLSIISGLLLVLFTCKLVSV